MWRKGSQAQVLFRLRENLPHYRGERFNATALRTTIKGKNPQLTDDAKKILAWTAIEAEAMNDYWIDTDHLLLGILCEPRSLAAQHLSQVGITLKNVRAVVIRHGRSRSGRPMWLNWLLFRWRERKRKMPKQERVEDQKHKARPDADR